MVHDYTYVLVTPARNEETHIEKTIQAVIGQTILPQKWVIVSDGSTDHTDDIVRRYAENHQFIHFVRIDGKKSRTFSSKVNAFNVGYTQLTGVPYNFIGVVDADVSFSPSYFESIIDKFHSNKKLGVAGGVRHDFSDGKFIKPINARYSVGGPVQLFRRTCFEQIDGFTSTEIGIEDTIADVEARMRGWQTESFPEIIVYHYRRTGTADANIIKAKFREGKKDYLIGNHPLFEIVKCLRRMTEPPYVIGSVLRMSGFLWSSCCRYQRPVSENFLRFLRTEQMTTLSSLTGKRSVTACLL